MLSVGTFMKVFPQRINYQLFHRKVGRVWHILHDLRCPTENSSHFTHVIPQIPEDENMRVLRMVSDKC